MSAGWLKVRRTDYETFEKQKIMPHALSIILGYLVCWSWHAYFKPKDHYIIGRPHGATILDRIMKNETANPPTPSPRPKSWMTPRKSQNAPFSHPCLKGRRYKFPIYFVQTSRWNSCPRQLMISTTDTCEGKTTITNQWGSAGSLVDLDQ